VLTTSASATPSIDDMDFLDDLSDKENQGNVDSDLSIDEERELESFLAEPITNVASEESSQEPESNNSKKRTSSSVDVELDELSTPTKKLKETEEVNDTILQVETDGAMEEDEALAEVSTGEESGVGQPTKDMEDDDLDDLDLEDTGAEEEQIDTVITVDDALLIESVEKGTELENREPNLCHWNESGEWMQRVFSAGILDFHDLGRMLRVSKRWQELCSHPNILSSLALNQWQYGSHLPVIISID